MVMLRAVFDTEAQPLEKISQSNTWRPNLHFLTVNLKPLKIPNCWSFTLCMWNIR